MESLDSAIEDLKNIVEKLDFAVKETSKMVAMLYTTVKETEDSTLDSKYLIYCDKYELTKTETKIFIMLFKNRGNWVSIHDITNKIWNRPADSDARALLRVNIGRIRKKLDGSNLIIKVLRGAAYSIVQVD